MNSLERIVTQLLAKTTGIPEEEFPLGLEATLQYAVDHFPEPTTENMVIVEDGESDPDVPPPETLGEVEPPKEEPATPPTKTKTK